MLYMHVCFVYTYMYILFLVHSCKK